MGNIYFEEVIQGLIKNKLLSESEVNLFPIIQIVNENGISRKELNRLIGFGKKVGKENFSKIIENVLYFSSYKQIKKKFPESSFAFKTHFFIEKFHKEIENILDNSELQKKGYKIRFFGFRFADPPLNAVLRIFSDKKKSFEFSNFGFDLFLKKENPCAILGNHQGNSREENIKFKETFGVSSLNYFIRIFKKVFPKNRIIALNPAFHAYKNPDKLVIVNKLIDLINEGKLKGFTAKELKDFAIWKESFEKQEINYVKKTFNISVEKMKKINTLFELERKRIISHATGMHKSAFKKEGFVRKEKTISGKKPKFWRLK